MNNYLDFLTDLWKITKEDGSFKAFSALISKHKVNRSVSAVLTQDLGYVTKTGEGYEWVMKKPSKTTAELIQVALKQRLADMKNKTVVPISKNDIESVSKEIDFLNFQISGEKPKPETTQPDVKSIYDIHRDSEIEALKLEIKNLQSFINGEIDENRNVMGELLVKLKTAEVALLNQQKLDLSNKYDYQQKAAQYLATELDALTKQHEELIQLNNATVNSNAHLRELSNRKNTESDNINAVFESCKIGLAREQGAHQATIQELNRLKEKWFVKLFLKFS